MPIDISASLVRLPYGRQTNVKHEPCVKSSYFALCPGNETISDQDFLKRKGPVENSYPDFFIAQMVSHAAFWTSNVLKGSGFENGVINRRQREFGPAGGEPVAGARRRCDQI